MKKNKRIQSMKKKINVSKSYKFIEAIDFFQKNSSVKFIESLDVIIKLNIDVKKDKNNIQGTTLLPYSRKKKIRIAAFVERKDFEKAKSAGADLIGLNNIIKQVENDNVNFDIIIAHPETMKFISKIGKKIGSKGLIPNPNLGTLTSDISKSIKEFKSNRISYKNDKYGIIHVSIGKVNFKKNILESNFKHLINSIVKRKPKKIKKSFIKNIYISPTMGIALKIHSNILNDK